MKFTFFYFFMDCHMCLTQSIWAANCLFFIFCKISLLLFNFYDLIMKLGKIHILFYIKNNQSNTLMYEKYIK